MNTVSPSKLSQLRDLSVVVADTGDYEAIKRLKPVDCTTNPTLVKKALDLPVYADLIERELAWGREQAGERETIVHAVADRLTVGVGTLLSTLVPGRVSTEVDADLAHDTASTVTKARQFIAMYEAAGVPRSKVLIKIAATWEGVEAARQLQAEGIDCNLTLIFNPTQAIACAEAGAFLISPFVGRILDWYVANGQAPATIDEDPGVVFVRGVYAEFKRRGSPTVVMGASFRSTAQIEALAGCDRLTISPALLAELADSHSPVIRQLHADVPSIDVPGALTEAEFRWQMLEDQMATDKLQEGIRQFAADQQKLEVLLMAV